MNTTETITRPAAISDALPDVGCYFACLAAYNSGRLHGAWVDLEEISDTDDLQECIDWILATSPEPGAEEWAMHDHAGLPGCLSRSEWPDLEELASFAEAIAGMDDEQREAYRLLSDDRGEILGADDFEEAYHGRHDSGEDFAYQLAEDVGVMPDQCQWPLSCIDWQRAWRELEIGGDYHAEPASCGGVFVFRSC